MDNFFFNGLIEDTTIKEETSVCNSEFFADCPNPVDSRNFNKGKSIRCWDWEKNQDRKYLNDDFYQDFAVYENCLYLCLKDTTDKPGASDDWLLVVDQIPGKSLYPIIDSGGNISWKIVNEIENIPETVNLKGPQGESAYETWLQLGNSGTEQDFINSLRGQCILEWEERD